MDPLSNLREIYREYEEQLNEVCRTAHPLAGAFGMSGGPGSHPCNMAFYNRVESWVDAYVQTRPRPEEAAEAAAWILFAAAGREKEPVYWYCFTAQAHVKKLIPLLSPADCGRLRVIYNAKYPKSLRLPVHREIYRLLCAGETQKTETKGNV